jgi:hypothetical protein
VPGSLRAEEDVGTAVPAAAIVEEGTLDDDVLAGAHDFEGGGGGGFGVLDGAQVEDRAALGSQVVDVGLLVSEASLFQDVAEGVVSVGALAAFEGHGHVEAGELAAGEGVREVGGGEAQAGFGFAHPGRLGGMGPGWGPMTSGERLAGAVRALDGDGVALGLHSFCMYTKGGAHLLRSGEESTKHPRPRAVVRHCR